MGISPTSSSASTRLRVYPPNETSFKPGWPGGPGRPRGSKNRVQADLTREILKAAAKVGFIKHDDKGNPIATGEDGVKGYLRWAALNEPEAFLALLARALPYAVGDERPPGSVLTREETSEDAAI